MPNPAQVHISTALTNISVGYSQQQQEYVSDKIFPIVPVMKKFDEFYVIDPKQDGRRPVDTRRAPKAAVREVDFGFESAGYRCEDHALADLVTDEERENADAAIAPELDTTEMLTGLIDLNKEVECVETIESVLNTEGTNLITLSNPWDDFVNGDPVTNITTGIDLFVNNTNGLPPNTLTIPYSVFIKLKNHPDILSRISGGATIMNPAAVTANTLAQLFGVDSIFIPKCYKNAAKKGFVQGAPIWTGDDVVLSYVPPRPGLKTPAFGYTFAWLASGSVKGYIVEKWREGTRKSDFIAVHRYFDQKVVMAAAGVRFKSTLTPKAS